MTLEERIQNEITLAIKQKQEVRLGALRNVKTSILNEKTKGSYHELTDADVISILQKMVKQAKEAAEIYRTATPQRNDLAEIEDAERIVYEEFVPAQMSPEEVDAKVKDIIAEVGATSMKDMRLVMPVAMQRLKSVADGSVISASVKKNLS